MGISTFSKKNIIQIAIPIMVGNLAQTIITFVDTAFLGHLGRIELGAAMMAGLYYYVFSTLAWGFAVGIQIIVARRFGEGNYHEIGAVFKHGLLVVLALAILLFLPLHFLTDTLLGYIISSPDIRAVAMQFMDYRHFGIIFVCFNYLFRSFYVGLSNTKVITYTTVLMAVVNIFFDYCLIFGHCSMPALGVRGAAIASVMAECSALLLFILYTIFQLPTREYAIFPLQKCRWPLIKSIVTLSLPTMGQRFVSFGSWFLFFVMIEQTGELPIAVSGIVRSVYMLILVPVFAFGATANSLTSRIIGEGAPENVHPLVRRITRMSLVFISALVLVCLVIPEKLALIYTDDVTLAHAAVPSLFVICLGALMQCWAVTLFEAISGTGKTMVAFLLEASVLVAYITYIWLATQVLHLSIEGVWCAEIVYCLLLGIACQLYMKYGKWQAVKVG